MCAYTLFIPNHVSNMACLWHGGYEGIANAPNAQWNIITIFSNMPECNYFLIFKTNFCHFWGKYFTLNLGNSIQFSELNFDLEV